MSRTQTIEKVPVMVRAPRVLDYDVLQEDERRQVMTAQTKIEPKPLGQIPSLKAPIFLTKYEGTEIEKEREEPLMTITKMLGQKELVKPTKEVIHPKVISSIWPQPTGSTKYFDPESDELVENINTDTIDKAKMEYKYGLANSQVDLPMNVEEKYLLKGANEPVLRTVPNYVPLQKSYFGGNYGTQRDDYNKMIMKENLRKLGQ